MLEVIEKYDLLKNKEIIKFINNKINKKINFELDFLFILYTEDDIYDINELINYNKFYSFCMINNNSYYKNYNITCLYNMYLSDVIDTYNSDNSMFEILEYVYENYEESKFLFFIVDMSVKNKDEYLKLSTKNQFKNAIIMSSETIKSGPLIGAINDESNDYIVMMRKINVEYLYELDHEIEIEKFTKIENEEIYIDEYDEKYEEIKDKHSKVEYDKAKFVNDMYYNYLLYKNNKDDDLLTVGVKFNLPTLRVLNRLPYSNREKIINFNEKSVINFDNYEFSGIFRVCKIDKNILTLELDNHKDILQGNSYMTSKLQVGEESEVYIENSTYNFHSHPYSDEYMYSYTPSFRDLFLQFMNIGLEESQCPSTFICSHFGMFGITVKTRNYKKKMDEYIKGIKFFEELIILMNRMKDEIKNIDDKLNFDIFEYILKNVKKPYKFLSYINTINNFMDNLSSVKDLYIKMTSRMIEKDELKKIEESRNLLSDISERIKSSINKEYSYNELNYMNIYEKIYNINSIINHIDSINTSIKFIDSIIKNSRYIDDIKIIYEIKNIMRDILDIHNDVYDENILSSINDINYNYMTYKEEFEKFYGYINKRISKYLLNENRIDKSKIIDNDGEYILSRRGRRRLLFMIYRKIDPLIYYYMYIENMKELEREDIKDIIYKPFLQYEYYQERKSKKEVRILDNIIHKINKYFIESIKLFYPKTFIEIFNVKFISWYNLYNGNSTFSLFMQPNKDNNILPDYRSMYNLNFEKEYDEVEDEKYIKKMEKLKMNLDKELEEEIEYRNKIREEESIETEEDEGNFDIDIEEMKEKRRDNYFDREYKKINKLVYEI